VVAFLLLVIVSSRGPARQFGVAYRGLTEYRTVMNGDELRFFPDFAFLKSLATDRETATRFCFCLGIF